MAKNPSYLLIILIIVLIYLMDLAVVDKIQEKVRKSLVLDSLQCEGRRQPWLQQVANYSIRELDYLNLQLSYIDNEGNTSACTAGWEGLPYITRRVTKNSILNYASVTKVFTSELILDLVRKQKISLNDKLISFLPEVKTERLVDARVADITISDLLSHRAGFDRNITNDSMMSTSPWCPYDIKMLQRMTLDFEPNSKNVYSNVGYCLLSKVIENIYLKSYTDISQDYFNFDNSDIHFIQSNMADQPNIPNISNDAYLSHLDFYALASVGGLTGSSNELARHIYNMNRTSYPNVISRPEHVNCDKNKVRGCHGLSSYEYAPSAELTLYWRDGRLPKASALVAMDSNGGVLSFLTNTTNETTWLEQHNKLVAKIYTSHLLTPQ
ncbi:serine hydrolase domain-containing protein [Psychrobacter sp.]|uniref:serine hydrolase domain-containing protein n=1 Tax=Psychrobacter sp. TaxID=56811 RepID=UPI003C76940E